MKVDPRSKRAGWVVRVVVVIVWLFGVTAAYFWAHKPLDAALITGLGRSLVSVAGWLGIAWLGAGVGRRLAGGLFQDEAPIARLALSAGLGLGLLSLLTLGLGLVGLLRTAVVWVAVLALSAGLWRQLWAVWLDLRSIDFVLPPGGIYRWLAVYGGVSLLLTLIVALAPPIGWDSLVYHLAGPHRFVAAGRVVHDLDLPYLGFPQLGEMQFTLGLLLVGEGVAPLLHYGYGLLAVAITAASARRFFGTEVAWLAGGLLLAVPSLLSLMTRAYVDVTLLFYTAAALYALLRWRQCHGEGSSAGNRRWLLVLGLMCGFCGSVKYTAVAVPAALVLSVIWVSRRDGLPALLGRAALVASAAALVIAPGLLENWLTTGNPVYPFVFANGIYWDAWRGWWYDRPGTGLAGEAPWRLLTAPLEATILGTEGTILYDATIGPLLFAGLCLLPLVWSGIDDEERAVIGHVLLLVGVNYVLWLVGLARTALLLQTRMLLLVFGPAAVVAAVALQRLGRLDRPQLRVSWLARAVVSLTLVLLLVSQVVQFLQINPLPVVLGLEARDAYLTRRLGWYYVMVQDLNRELPPGSIVLFLWEPRSYHCRVTCWPDALLDRFLHATHVHGHDAGAIAAAWRGAGVTHVLLGRAGMESVVEDGFDPITPQDLAVMDELTARYLLPVDTWHQVYELYELSP